MSSIQDSGDVEVHPCCQRARGGEAHQYVFKSARADTSAHGKMILAFCTFLTAPASITYDCCNRDDTVGEGITVISCNMKLWREALNASGGWRKKLEAFKSYMAAKPASYEKISYVVGQWWMINRPALCFFCLFPFFLASSLSPHVAGAADRTIWSISGSPNQIPPLYRSANGFARKN